MKILLLGGTDLTVAVAERLKGIGFTPAGIVFLDKSFSISYSATSVANVRHGDLRAWCALNSVPGIKYDGPTSIKRFQDELKCDFAIVAGWYHIIPLNIRILFSKGIVGIHHSLLPKFRGGAPLNWAILSGASEAGTSIFALGDGVDDGLLYGQKKITINPGMEISELIRNAEAASLELLVEVVRGLEGGSLKPFPQSGDPTYCLQRTPQDSRIDWLRPAKDIDSMVRASSRPYSGAWTLFEGRKILIWKSVLPQKELTVLGSPGQIFILPERSPMIITGDGLLQVIEAEDENGGDMLRLILKAGNKRFL